MKLLKLQKEGNLYTTKWRKVTLICCGVPLIAREAYMLDSPRGGAINNIYYKYKLFDRLLIFTGHKSHIIRIWHWYDRRSKSFTNIINAPDFAQKLDRLCVGLDTASRNTIVRTLARIQHVTKNKSAAYSDLSQEEVRALTDVILYFSQTFTSLHQASTTTMVISSRHIFSKSAFYGTSTILAHLAQAPSKQ